MASRMTEVVVDCHDLDRMADFWCAVLDRRRVDGGDTWVGIGEPGADRSAGAARAGATTPMMSFVLVPEGKRCKNRVHIDVTPVDGSRDEEVARLEALGATRADIGQRDTPWVVMTDPEGNEFCVMPGGV